MADVWTVASKLAEYYGGGTLHDASEPNAVHEAKLLTLDITKAQQRLGWTPRLSLDATLQLTADWYRRYRTEDAGRLCEEQIDRYLNV